MLGKLLRLCILLLLAPALYSLGYEACAFLAANSELWVQSTLASGFVVYLAVYLLIPPSVKVFLEIFEHELGHAIVGFLMLRRVEEFKVHVPLGSVASGTVVTKPRSNTLIRLAPYFFPVFTIPLLVVKLFAFSSVHGVIDFLIGFSLAFHFVALAREFRISQPDIWRTGVLFSFGFTLVLNLALLVIIVCVTFGIHSDISNYFYDSFARMPESYTRALQIAQKGLQAIPRD